MAAIGSARENARYLPGITLPERLRLVDDDALPDAIDVLVAAVPFQTLRSVLVHVTERSGEPRCIAGACKGLEHDTFARADEIVAELFADRVVFAMLSGPNFAREVAEGRPAAITVATADAASGSDLVDAFHSAKFRPYLSDDVIGVEIGGATKNVMAIAAGISDGLGLGSNSRAALITRGLAEITRFGVAQGGRLETFMGLSGLGDLVLTCTDDQSRNRRFGLGLAAGRDVDAARSAAGLVEGATTALALDELAEACGIDMPITREVAATIRGDTTPANAVRNLLARDPVTETRGLGGG